MKENKSKEGFWQYGRYWENTQHARSDPYWRREYSKDMLRIGVRGIFFGVDNRDPELQKEVEEEEKKKKKEKQEEIDYIAEHPGSCLWSLIKMICYIIFFPPLCPIILGIRYPAMNHQQKESYQLAWFFSLLALIFGIYGFIIVFTLFGLHIIFDEGDGRLP